MKAKGMIFDLDGTLLDSMRVWDDLGERYLLNIGIFPKPGLGEALKSMSAMQAAEYMKREYCLKTDTEEIVRGFNRLIESFYKDEALLKPGVREALKVFCAHGVRMCVATASDRELAKAALIRNGLAEYFSAIITCGELSMGKDDPAFYESALEQLGTEKADTAVFEDALHAARTAKEAGFRVVGVYEASAEGERAEMEEICDWYVLRMDDRRVLCGLC